ncbi:flavodoxin [Bacteroides xylanisolvens]|nr:flavodoxin [Bacteroides xylanisolvens]
MVKKDAKAIVVYFSATGNTKRAAEIIARTKGLDVWEIKPKEPYTDSDLDYTNDNSRVSREHQDRSLMPEIDGDVPGWDSYETVFLGYPIWWGEAPNIVYHFVRSHDFSGKQVIPFCTSHSSGLGDSDVLLEETAKSGEWFPGTRFSGGVSESDLIDWSRHF